MDIIDTVKSAIESVQNALSSKNVLETSELGDLNALELLTAQHRELDVLFTEYEEAGEKAFRTKEKIYERVAEKIRRHAELEETYFYPAAARVDIALVREAQEEHGVVREMLAKIDELAAEDSTFGAKVNVLKELIQRHMRAEEREMFPECKSRIAEDKLDEIGATMHAQTLKLGSSLKEVKGIMDSSKTH